jgi:hypothetical protein
LGKLLRSRITQVFGSTVVTQTARRSTRKLIRAWAQSVPMSPASDAAVTAFSYQTEAGPGSHRGYPGAPLATAPPNERDTTTDPVVEHDFFVRQGIYVSRQGGREREFTCARQHPAAKRAQEVASDPEPSLFRVGLLCRMCIGERRNGHAGVVDAHDARIRVE